MRMSTLSHLSVTCVTRASTASPLVMSVEMPKQARPGAQRRDSCSLASESFWGLRAAITTLYPFLAKSSAVARPTPCNSAFLETRLMARYMVEKCFHQMASFISVSPCLPCKALLFSYEKN